MFKAKFGELAGSADATDSANSGEGLGRGKPLTKPKSKMDSYRVNRLSYHFGHALLHVDGPLRDCSIRESDKVTISCTLLHRLEMHA